MIKHDLNDTIAAMATAAGEAGIGIVRLSGKEALSIADKIFRSQDAKKPSGFKTYTVHYGWIIGTADKAAPGQVIDEVILTVMRAPKSYTKEDVVEINCHGGIVALGKILELVLACGARLAEPGEFTKRAFLNGRIDLAQAEAVLDIIRAKTDYALKIGVEQLEGVVSRRINKISGDILGALSVLEANIDFPEEEIGAADLKKMARDLAEVNLELKDILDNSLRAKILRQGLNVVICGRPNVGKSSLLNALLKKERSIVTPIPGTTRDTVEEFIGIKGIPVRIIDTAGIMSARDEIEREAVRRSRESLETADLVLLLFDASRRLVKDDLSLMRKLKKKTCIAVINKIDLRQAIQRQQIEKYFPEIVEISANKMKNIGLLEERIAGLVYAGKALKPDSVLVSNLRHIETLKRAQKFIAQALNSLDNNLSIEFVAQDLKDALFCLDDILGKRVSQDLLDSIFSRFCIGK